MEIDAFGLHRMFIGDTPWLFTLEIAFRTAFLLVFTYALVRTLGRRTVGQLSLVEFLLVVAIGSAVGDPMFYPDVPLLHGMIVITVTVGLNRTLTWLILNSEQVETAVEGIPLRLVADGVLDLEAMTHANMAQDELFERLRLRGIAHLGETRAVYAEPNGQVSIFRHDPGEERPGLPIEPPLRFVPALGTGDTLPAGVYACRRCGRTRTFSSGRPSICTCGGMEWAHAADGSHAVQRDR